MLEFIWNILTWILLLFLGTAGSLVGIIFYIIWRFTVDADEIFPNVDVEDYEENSYIKEKQKE